MFSGEGVVPHGYGVFLHFFLIYVVLQMHSPSIYRGVKGKPRPLFNSLGSSRKQIRVFKYSTESKMKKKKSATVPPSLLLQ